MNKYEKPAMQVIELSASDVITTSGGITGGNNTGEIGGGGNED